MQTPDKDGEHCSFHSHWLFVPGEPDEHYHRKVVKGLCSPTFDYLTPEEARATMAGRSRGDGRRLDAYCSDDPNDYPAA